MCFGIQVVSSSHRLIFLWRLSGTLILCCQMMNCGRSTMKGGMQHWVHDTPSIQWLVGICLIQMSLHKNAVEFGLSWQRHKGLLLKSLDCQTFCQIYLSQCQLLLLGNHHHGMSCTHSKSYIQALVHLQEKGNKKISLKNPAKMFWLLCGLMLWRQH